MWWLDYSILNLNNIKFKYSKFNNIFYITLINFYYFFLINKKNLNSMLFYNLDGVITSLNNKNSIYFSIQTFFYDLQILLDISFNKYLPSISKIYSGNSWLERELKEFNNIFFINLLDNRKLLTNYNYNNNLEYNHFNQILGDIKIIQMLFWCKFFVITLLLSLTIFNVFLANLMTTVLALEFVTMLIFFIYLFSAVLVNAGLLFAFIFIMLILGGLEIALSFLLLNL